MQQQVSSVAVPHDDSDLDMEEQRGQCGALVSVMKRAMKHMRAVLELPQSVKKETSMCTKLNDDRLTSRGALLDKE